MNRFAMQCGDDYRRVLKSESWQFRLGTDTVGYDGIEYPRFGGIAIKDRLVYFVDPELSRVNSLHMGTGAVSLGMKGCLSIESEVQEIDNIAYFSGHVVAVTGHYAIFLDHTLKRCHYSKFPFLSGHTPTIRKISSDTLVLYCPVDTNEDSETTPQGQSYILLEYDTNLQLTSQIRGGTLHDVYEEYKSDRVEKARGKSYHRFHDGKGEWMDIGWAKLEIPSQFSRSISWDNMDFDRSHIVFWDIDEANRLYTITVLFYSERD